MLNIGLVKIKMEFLSVTIMNISYITAIIHREIFSSSKPPLVSIHRTLKHTHSLILHSIQIWGDRQERTIKKRNKEVGEEEEEAEGEEEEEVGEEDEEENIVIWHVSSIHIVTTRHSHFPMHNGFQLCIIH